MTATATPGAAGVVDYLCNSFLPRRAAQWDESIARQGVPVKRRREVDDSFVEAGDMVARMDDLGVATLIVVAGDFHHSAHAFTSLGKAQK